MVVQQKLLEKAYFIIKPTGRAMVWPASSDKWKAPQSKCFSYLLAYFLVYKIVANTYHMKVFAIVIYMVTVQSF